ncbi:SirB2 family protein [Paraglaciecola arctica]|uniref:SirB2 family protein n=1 Tax=Paraglaciecola arctica TaxID=1128911 RepID=UPI001C06B195|nr:SirB2 family protein [Paraglaciecola arctica]MBU3006026.1 SirB2 family protein [Paraglaciecola arctica]
MYEIVKHTHLTAIALSVLLFLVRFVLNALQSPMAQKKWLKIVPHIVDTVLLITVVTLCILLKQYPFVDAWVTEKLLALVMYIFMVTLALKLGRNGLMRGVGLVGALCSIAYAGMVAVSKQPILF